MPLVKYRIYELSARAVISYGREQDGAYTFRLSAAETEKCKSLSAPHEQDDNALFYQTMCVLRSDAFTGTPGGQLVTDLSDIIFYMDFSGIFDRSGARKKHLIRQEKARALFRPEGVSLDFGSGAHRYLAFERSGSMSRQARLAFIREDFYDTVCRRIMMDMTIGDCQLSKLYAYNGLMLSSGIRIDGIGIDRPHRVVVIDNPTRTERNVSVITVEDDGTQSSTRKYHRVEKKEDIEITCFDGEGLISKEYARVVDEKLCGKKVHTSFQIRMPYVKGMLHEVDFKDFLTLCGTDTITDLWGMEHSVRDVDVILTKSMFKGYGWLTASGMNWEDYRTVFRKYRHALYITNVSKEKPEQTTELNYQFLTTVSIQGDEFRPADLPDGWDHSPETDERNWLTKQTELAYYNFCADESFRQNYFLEKFERVSWWERHQGKDQILAAVLKKNPSFINEPVYAKRLEDEADKIVEQYAVGRLIVAGDNRYLSGDLLDFLAFLLPTVPPRKRRQRMFYSTVMTDHFPESSFYAPQAAYMRFVLPPWGTGSVGMPAVSEAAPVPLPACHWSVVHQLAEDDLLGLRFQAVHQPHPFHLVAGFQLLRHARRLHQLRHHLLQSPIRRLVDLPQVGEQLLRQHQTAVQPRSVLLKVAPAQSPVLAQGSRVLRRLAQRQVGNQVVPVLGVGQLCHGYGSFPRISRARNS